MNRLRALADRHRRGACAVFASGPFVSMASLRAAGLQFHRVLTEPEDMAAAALLNLDFGFEATVVPFDMNVEAELIGCPVHYHAEVDGVPVYPTVGERRIERAEDFELPEDVTQGGRVAAVTAAIGRVRQQAAGRGAVGAFVPGPFTLAGQVLDPDRMFLTVLKKPEIMEALLGKLTDLLIRVRNAYGAAGADFVVVEEGGAGSISPKSFQRLVLPQLKRLFDAQAAPHVLHLAGHAERTSTSTPWCCAGPCGSGAGTACWTSRPARRWRSPGGSGCSTARRTLGARSTWRSACRHFPRKRSTATSTQLRSDSRPGRRGG